jgi:hypothetical protein
LPIFDGAPLVYPVLLFRGTLLRRSGGQSLEKLATNP